MSCKATLKIVGTALVFASAGFGLIFGSAPAGATQTLKDPAALKAFLQARTKLQSGVDDWDAKLMAEGRDLLLGCLGRVEPENPYLLYYAGLAEYTLATWYFAAEDMAECDKRIAEGKAYLEKAMTTAPGLGEPMALYGYLLGLEAANHQDLTFIFRTDIFDYFDKAMAADGSNPRVFLLRGIFQLYVPEAFGGGPDSSLEYLNKAIALFEKEKVSDPFLPSWGKDEAFLNAAIAYKEKGDPAKAVELLKKALTVNPRSGRARGELAAIEK